MNKNREYINLEARPYTQKQLAIYYGVSVKVLKNWLKNFTELLGARKGHFYNLEQVKIIFDKLGVPEIPKN